MAEDDAPDLDDLGDLDGPEDDELDDELDDDEGGTGKEDDDKSWKPPTKGEWERAQRRLKKYAAKERGKGTKADEQLAAQLRGGKGGQDDEDDGQGPDAFATQAAENKAKRLAGVAALMGAGLTKDQAKRAVGLLDLRNVELDEDGDADLEDEVEELKEQFPNLFETTVRYRRPPAARRTAETRPAEKDPTRKTDEALLRSAGFSVGPTRRR